MRNRMIAVGVMMTALLAGPFAALHAQTLNIGMQTETTSLDPHVAISNQAVSVARHMFDTLVHPDARQGLQPGLALNWAAIGPMEWEFRLRPHVRFHDGTAFTAADVASTLTRARDGAGAPTGFGVMTKQITDIAVVDPLTIRLRTAQPFPLMAEHLSAVPMISHRIGTDTPAGDFNSGKAAIGTGPFRIVSWTRADHLRLARNDAYWGGAPAWAEVTIRPIANDAVRVAALLSGAVDMIDQVPSPSVATLRARADMAVAQTVSNRVIYLAIHHDPAANPQVKDAGGTTLAANPFADRRVRLALAKAINRDAMIQHVLERLATPASQLLPDGYPGTSNMLRPESYDPGAARALLAEAGFKDGFTVTLLVPRDRNASDTQIGEALAQMFGRIGLRVSLDVLPYSIAQPRFKRGDFALALRGWGTETGEASMALRAILGSSDSARGWGSVNGGRYANPALDALLNTALSTQDPKQREAMVAQATEIGIADVGIIPLHYQMAIWAMRRGLTYQARSDNYTFAFDVRPNLVR